MQPEVVFYCEECEKPCDPVEIDEGNYEEAWGRPVWRPCWTVVSDCCHAYIFEEIDEEA